MLLERTKAKEAARPRRNLVSLGARLLPRTMAPVVGRSYTVRAVNEQRKAAQNIVESVRQTHVAVGVLRHTHAQVEKVQERRVTETKILNSVEKRLKDARGSLGSVLSQKSRGEADLAVLETAMHKVNRKISEGVAEAVRIEDRVKKIKGVEEKITARIDILTAELNDSKKQTVRSNEEKVALESEIRGLKAKSEKMGRKIGEGKRRYDEVMSVTAEATESFRIFERRIVRFSKETGYIVGYPKLSKT